MTMETLKRIMWRLREGSQGEFYSLKDVTWAIMNEAGLDERTIKKYTNMLVEHGLMKRHSRWSFEDLGKVY